MESSGLIIRVPFVEIIPIPDTFVTNIGSVQIMGPTVRVTYVVWEDGQHIVAAKLVWAIDAWPYGTLKDMIRRARNERDAILGGVH